MVSKPLRRVWPLSLVGAWSSVMTLLPFGTSLAIYSPALSPPFLLSVMIRLIYLPDRMPMSVMTTGMFWALKMVLIGSATITLSPGKIRTPLTFCALMSSRSATCLALSLSPPLVTIRSMLTPLAFHSSTAFLAPLTIVTRNGLVPQNTE